MKSIRKVISLVLALVLAFSCMSLCAYAGGVDEEVLYLNFGDSIAWGRIENEENFPDYDYEKDSYSGLFASYLGTERVSYARRGMQTTDILYMIDDEFRSEVDSGTITPDTWHWYEYPPYDGTPLEQIKTDIAAADHISLCVGVCDYLSYPDDVHTQALEKLPDEEAAKARLEELLAEGRMDEEIYEAFMALMKISSEKTRITLSYVLDMLEGYADFAKYYPRIVEDFRLANEEATIILLGSYIPGGTVSFLMETPEASPIIFLLNRLLDNINLVVKDAAVRYHCYYVDTMGVESDWHPTVNGHRLICDRMVSVLEGDPTYAGSVTASTEVAGHLLEKLGAFIEMELKHPGTAGIFGIIMAIVRALTGLIRT